MIDSTNLTPEALQNYLEILQRQYSDASLRRKLSSLRRYLDYLTEKGNIQPKQSQELKSTLQSAAGKKRDTRIRRLPTKSIPQDLYSQLETQQDKMYDNLSEDISSIKSSIKYLPSRIQNHSFATAVFLLLFLFFSLNVFFLGRIKTAILNRIDAATITQPIADKSSEIAVALPITATLKDNLGIPLSYEQDINFSIYQSPQAQEPLYTTGRCPITPNNDGILRTTLGEDCGQPIPYNLFLDYPELYLGVNLGFGEELSPRLRLKQFQLAFSTPTPSPTLIPLPTFSPQFIDLENLVASPSASPSAESSPSAQFD